MNFEVMPELKWRLGYPAVLVVIALLCGTLFALFSALPMAVEAFRIADLAE